MRHAFPLILLNLLLIAPSPGEEPPKPLPLPRAHAHNDYEHPGPLFDALDAGFCSVEADIHLIDGRLLVAHDRDQVDAARTLQKLYLDPLKERAGRNGGSIHEGKDAPPFSLLIDLKSEAQPTYAALHDVLAGYAGMLTTFEGANVRQGGVTVIISGNRPREMMEMQAFRYAGYDGRLADLAGDSPASFMPWISDNFALNFKWRGHGEMPEVDRKKLADIVSQAHEAGKKLRLWGAPDFPASWKALRDAGVDLINTDKLEELRVFFAKPVPAEAGK